jgi:hypothetical protein
MTDKVLVSDLELKIKLSEEIILIDKTVHVRITYIADKICELYGRNKSYWSWLNLPYDYRYHRGNYSFGIKISSFDDNAVGNIILKDGSIHKFYDGFIPQRWLFEDFEEELVEGKKKYEQFLEEQNSIELKKKNDKQQKLRQEKEKQAVLLEQALGKLTKEEYKAICSHLNKQMEG